LFKYYEFILLSASDLAALCGFSINLGGALEYADFFVYLTGLSFFSFQAIAYLADCYSGKTEKAFSLVETASYLSFFPTVCAGPIMRPSEFIGQTQALHADETCFSEGICLILSGLLKKVVIASYLSEHVVNDVFSTPDACSSLTVIVGIYGYAAQIFCDFSGYSDLAMGIGRFFGFRLPQNFDGPYLSLSIRDFWRRWHITLSLWLRDYLYIPLGGSRRGNTYVNLLLTMVIGGLWHGSAWTFVIWGTLHGLGLVLHRLLSRLFKTFSGSLIWKAFSWLLTFHFVAALWVFFRADDLAIAKSVFKQAAAFSTAGIGCSLLAVAAILACFIIQLLGRKAGTCFTCFFMRLPWLLQGLLAGLLATGIMALGPEGTLPFIYFGF
ncbi:MAG: MBOAT family protein, partial [Mailhella sp.]|nr:MBOAT family protein [Mailhella sp.]